MVQNRKVLGALKGYAFGRFFAFACLKCWWHKGGSNGRNRIMLIKTNSFDGGSGLADGTLAAAVIGLAQHAAKVVAGTLTDLTDNSGGAAADGTIGAIPLASTAPLTGDTCPTKAEVETTFGEIKNALTEIAAQVVAVAAVVPAFTPTNSIGGTAADGTIAVVDVAFAGDTSGRVALTGFNAFITAARLLVAELARDVNKLCYATGVTQLVTTALPTLTTYDTTYAALSTDTGTAATNGLTSVTDTEAEASVVALTAAVKELSTKLNVITGATVPVAAAVAVA
jgi:hypothetical protein